MVNEAEKDLPANEEVHSGSYRPALILSHTGSGLCYLCICVCLAVSISDRGARGSLSAFGEGVAVVSFILFLSHTPPPGKGIEESTQTSPFPAELAASCGTKHRACLVTLGSKQFQSGNMGQAGA